jgi:hypothetical protein
MSNSKRQALETIIPRLEKLLPHLGNANAGEGEAARRAINRLLKAAGLDWHDLVAFLSESNEPLLEMLERLFAKDPDILVKIGLKGATFFHSANAPFADVVIDHHRETLPVSEKEFADWLRHLFFREMKKAPSPGAMRQAIETLSAHAKFDGERRDVHLRAAKIGEKIYLDIGDPEWRVVEIEASGWRMIEDSPIRFRRTAGMKPLPLPQLGGSIEQLRSLVNLNEQGRALCILDSRRALP